MKQIIIDLADEIVQAFFHIYNEENLVCRCCGSIKTDTRFIFQVLLLQTAYEKKFHITSYYRCENYNRLIGGAKKSRHLEGRAIDIIQPDEDKQKLVELAKQAGFTTILYYPEKKIFHLDNIERAIYIDLSRK